MISDKQIEELRDYGVAEGSEAGEYWLWLADSIERMQSHPDPDEDLLSNLRRAFRNAWEHATGAFEIVEEKRRFTRTVKTLRERD